MNKTSEGRIRVRSVRCKVSHKDYLENIKDNPRAFEKKHSYYYLLFIKRTGLYNTFLKQQDRK